MVTIYFISATGRILTDKSIEKILKGISKQSGLTRVNYKYRCGPIVNDPKGFLNEVSNLNIHDYDIAFIDSDLTVEVIDDKSKEEYVSLLKECIDVIEDPQNVMTTGMFLSNYLSGNKKENKLEEIKNYE